MSTSSAPASARRIRRGTLPLTAVSVLVVVAGIAGLLLGGAFGGAGTPAVRPATPALVVAHDGLRLQVPSGWARADVATPPGFVRPLDLRSADDGLRASVERLPATSATLLPAAFLRTLESPPDRPALLTLAGGRQAWRYRVPGQDGSMTLLYAAPTISGVATVACTAPIDASVPHGCEALARAVTVPGSRPLEPSTSAAFFSRLPATVTNLEAARRKGIGDLTGAKHAAGQALAADGLARAHKAAGAALAPVTGAGSGLPRATVGALAATATAYTELASAARARSPKPYAEASRAVTGADADLRRTMTKVTAAASASTRNATRVRSRPAAPTPAATATPAANAKLAATAKPATTPAASATPAATAKPAATTHAASKPDVTTPLTQVGPVESSGHGSDMSLVILLLLGAIAIFLAVRQTSRVAR